MAIPADRSPFGRYPHSRKPKSLSLIVRHSVLRWAESGCPFMRKRPEKRDETGSAAVPKTQVNPYSSCRSCSLPMPFLGPCRMSLPAEDLLV